MADPRTIALLRERLLAAGWNPIDVLLMEYVALVAMGAAVTLLVLRVPGLMEWWPWKSA
jgi:hypothetical protein